MGIFKKKNLTEKTKVKEETKSVKLPKKEKEISLVSSVIVRPLVTEKSAILASKNMYVFVVKNDANRIQVAAAVKAMYDIKPLTVNVMNVRGKTVRRGRVEGKRKAWKKAIVTLPKGKSLNIYEGV